MAERRKLLSALSMST